MIEIIDTKWTRGNKKLKYLHINIKFDEECFSFVIRDIRDIIKITLYFAKNKIGIFILLLRIFRLNKKECKKTLKLNNKLRKILGNNIK